MTRTPNFIIIGAMKCATSSLHVQLGYQPGIFMAEPKEPNFFSNDEVWRKGLEWYEGLYKKAGKRDLCGEASTHYTKLPTYPRTIDRMRAHVPDAKLIYVIRHPIDRLVSHYIHDWTERKINEPIEKAVALYSELTDYSLYSMQIRPFLKTYGPENILLVFFEHLLTNPQEELDRIAKFIGYYKKPLWHSNDATNVSSKRMRKSILRDTIVWNPVSNWLRRTFISQEVRDWVKRFWQMKKRPELGEDIRKNLESIFDEDLVQLSKWIDKDISCHTFKTVGGLSMPVWSNCTPL